MAKILITGIAGFLGSHLADALIKKKHRVIGIDNMIGGYLDNVPEKTIFLPFDTADFKMMDKILNQLKPDIVYHCACTAYEGFSVFSPAFITQNNVQNTIGILSASIKHRVKRFIYCSSMSRYGDNPVPFTEDQIPKPEDPYAVGKVANEQIIKQMAETHKFEYVIAVPHNIIGPRQKYDDPYRNVASIMINRILQGKPPIIYGDGKQIRSFSFIQDCINILVKMINCPSGETYNIGPDDKDATHITINELTQVISKLLNYKRKPIYYPDRPREVKVAYCSSDKIRKEFGYKTKTSLREGLQQMIDDIKKKGVKKFDYQFKLEIEKGAPKTWTNQLI